MADQLPAPPLSADVDLRDFAFMPLDVVRLRDSSLSVEATGDEFRAAVLLWCTSWHQSPAGSLPDNDALLAQYAGYGRVVREWQKVREGALRGFIRCSDGRLYHPVVCEKAAEAWRKKCEHGARKAADRERKKRRAEQEATMELPTPSNGNTPSIPAEGCNASDGIPQENALKGQGQGQGQGDSREEGPPDGGSGRYAFEGQVIRLSHRDFNAWKASYHAIPDLLAELHSLDAFYATVPAKERKNWFVRASTALNNKHQEHAARQKPAAKPQPQLRDLLASNDKY